MIAFTPEFAATVFFLLCMVIGTWLDITERKLPNWLSLVVAVSGLITASFLGNFGSLISPLAHGVLALLAGMVLFGFGLIGGGDAKFYAATAIWFKLGEGVRFLLAVSLWGLVLIVIYLLWRRWLRRRAFTRQAPPDRGFPYGVAIALGAITLKTITLT